MSTASLLSRATIPPIEGVPAAVIDLVGRLRSLGADIERLG